MSGVDILTEQIRTVYRQTETVLLANCANAAIVSALIWSSAPRALVACWLALMAAVTAARVVLSRAYRRTPPATREARTWGRRFVVGCAASGALWGGAGFVFLKDATPVSQLIVVFFIGGMCSAAAGTLAAYLPAFVAFIAPALIGMALRVALFGDSLHLSLSGVIVLYGVGLVAVAQVNHRALADAFALRFENAELVSSLSLAQRTLEQNNRTLEQRVAERGEALRMQSEALRDAQRLEAIGRLAGGVAHDFNNLLTIILANISELAAHDGLDVRTRAALREMRDAGSKGADLVRQLLTFSRRQRSAAETLDLNQTLGSMDRLLSRLLGEGLTLRLSLQPQPLFVHMDPTQLQQVIINLITNARDAMTSRGTVSMDTSTVELREPLQAILPGTYALLRVTDTGNGMDAATRQRIFEPFFTTKEVGKGTGLGLSMVYGIVEQGGGGIDVSSELGSGSCFSVYLPLAEAPARAVKEKVGRSTSGFRPITRVLQEAAVLLVEDDPTVRSVTRRILEAAGHRVLTSASGEQALALASELAEPIDLLVTDVVMAGMDGPTLAASLRALRPELRTLFISGYSRDHVLPPDESQFTGFLAKPFTHDTLLAKVNELLAEGGDARRAVAPRQ